MIRSIIVIAILSAVCLWYLWLMINIARECRTATQKNEINDLIEESKKLEIPWPEKNDITVTDSMARHVTDRMRAKERYRG